MRYLYPENEKIVVNMKITVRKRAGNEHAWYDYLSKILKTI